MTGKWWPRYNKARPGQAILITGCDTGFGHEASQRLAAAGWVVYAGCLTDAGMAALAEKGRAAVGGGGGKLVPVQMDVTKQADVDRVVKRLVDDGVSLYALVNNAVRCLARARWVDGSIDGSMESLTDHRRNPTQLNCTLTTTDRASGAACPSTGPRWRSTGRSWR